MPTANERVADDRALGSGGADDRAEDKKIIRQAARWQSNIKVRHWARRQDNKKNYDSKLDDKAEDGSIDN